MNTHRPSRPRAPVTVKILGIDELDEEVTRDILTAKMFTGSNTDLSKFKNDQGEFLRWLHIFHVSPRASFHDTNLKVTSVIPWCSPEEEVDIEFHRAVMALGGYDNFPLAWRSFGWKLPAMENTPQYGVFTSNPGGHSFRKAIEDLTGYNPRVIPEGKENEFWDRMKVIVLVPRADGELIPTTLRSTKLRSMHDANSGSGEAGPQPV